MEMFLTIMDCNLHFDSNIKIDLYWIVSYHLHMVADSVSIHRRAGFSSMDSISTLDSNRITQLESHWDWGLHHTGRYCTSQKNCCSFCLVFNNNNNKLKI